MTVTTEIRQKNLSPYISPFKVTEGHYWNWHGSIDNLWLPIWDPQ